MERELKFLGDELEKPARPFVVILGGAKGVRQDQGPLTGC
jgi:3-phosphoglycerate kinase